VPWLDLLDGERVIAVTVSNAAWVERVLECPEMEYLGPALEDIVVHAEMLGRRRIRLVLEYRANQTGGAIGDSATLRLGLACRPFCC